MFPLVVHFSHSKNPKVEENRQKYSNTGAAKELNGEPRDWSSDPVLQSPEGPWASAQPL